MKTFLLTPDKWRMNKILLIRLDFMFFNYLILPPMGAIVNHGIIRK